MREERINTALKSRKSAKFIGKEIDLFGILETQKTDLVKEAFGPYFDCMVLGSFFTLWERVFDVQL